MARKRPKINLSQPIRPRSGNLNQLFSTADDVEQVSGLQLLAIRLDAIQPDPSQPRRTFPQESLEELSESIRQDGVIQPIEVAQIRSDLFLIVHGERRWRAAKIVGLETIPAVVRRRDYDEVTRFVRQLVENIQREDLNELDRAAGLLRLRDLLQEELDKAQEENVTTDQPWGTKITWAKVGQRLGYSRQRIHQLIKLLNLPEEIKEDVRDGRISERDTRIYQGLKPSQQRALHKARLAGDVDKNEVKEIARILKAQPDRTVYQTIRDMRKQVPILVDDELEFTTEISDLRPEVDETAVAGQSVSQRLEPLITSQENAQLPDMSTGTPVTSVMRLGYIRQHLARIQRQGLPANERQEILRLLYLIQGDVNSLIVALETDE
ncbi:MAG: ParB/RepB/Spo0J family partition protein [Chloroflexi bacterium]|nr:ParB/RepB/Spo0J family partition protein [Chloroflexota bacterium]